MEQNTEYRQKLLREYEEAAVPFLSYLPWFEQHMGQTGSTLYEGAEGFKSAMRFPVYDPTLMRFIREISQSALMDRNYPYIYTRNRIQTHDDERRRILSAQLKDWDILRGILSKYALGGRTRSALWREAVEENIFYLVLKQMQKIIEYWDKPLDAG